MLVFVSLAVLLVAPLGATATQDVLGEHHASLRGNLVSERVTLLQETKVGIAALDGLHFSRVHDEHPDLRFVVDAERATIEWTRDTAYSTFHPFSDHPEASYVKVGPMVDMERGQRTYAEPFIEAVTTQPDRMSVLVVSHDERSRGGMVTGQDDRMVVRTLPDGEYWRTGTQANGTVSPFEGDFSLQRSHWPDEGTPLAVVEGDTQGTLTGNFTVVVWGLEVTATTASQRDQYESGERVEDITGTEVAEGGVVREHHMQLIEIHVENGSMTWTHSGGGTYTTGQRFDMTTTGSVLIDRAQGLLESTIGRINVYDEPVQLQGNISLTTSPEPFSRWRDTLSIGLSGSDVWIDVPRTQEALTMEGHESAPWGPWVWVAIVAAVLLIATAGYGIYRYRASMDPDRPGWLINAEQAIIEKKPATARKVADRALDKDPENVDAWFIRGVTLAMDGMYVQLAEELEQTLLKLGDKGTHELAFLLVISQIRLGKYDEAGQWIVFAAQDPHLKQRIEQDPTFAPVRHHLNDGASGRSGSGGSYEGYA